MSAVAVVVGVWSAVERVEIVLLLQSRVIKAQQQSGTLKVGGTTRGRLGLTKIDARHNGDEVE